uniref:Chitin synthase n=1 Tax=Mycena chlorophos TaxID=658473 RepID=A0ABQ0KX78_MYCCL|nr:chitin synthase [Mycena chlorophos]
MSQMVSCAVCDTKIKGLCGETKVVNKAKTFVTMMQEYEKRMQIRNPDIIYQILLGECRRHAHAQSASLD